MNSRIKLKYTRVTVRCPLKINKGRDIFLQRVKFWYLRWVPMNTNPETKMWVQVDYLGVDFRKCQLGVGEVIEGCERREWKVGHWAITGQLGLNTSRALWKIGSITSGTSSCPVYWLRESPQTASCSQMLWAHTGTMSTGGGWAGPL